MNLRFLILLAAVACAAPAASSDARILATAPLRFEPATQGPADRFVARGARYHFEFAGDHAALQTSDKTVRLDFQGAARNARLEGRDLLRSRTGLFLGSDRRAWRSGIPNYGRLEVRGLYPGVDLIYYGNARELEYDLHVKPGADVRQIRLRLSGERARLDRDGNLVSTLMQKRPVAYQIGADGARVEVKSRYQKNRDGSYGFMLGHYDPANELVIDPVITLASYLSGPSFQDIAYAIGHDAAGFEYVAGTTDSGDFPVTGDARQGTLSGINDLFVVKLDPHAAPGTQIVYATYLGGALNETFGGMAVSPRGDVYLTGSTLSSDFPTVNGYKATLTTSSTSNAADAFVVWIDSNLDLAYSTYLGGTSADAGYAITYEGTAKLWVTGGTQSDDFPIVGGLQSTRGGSQDIFIAGIDLSQAPQATLVYSSYLGGTWWETGRGIALAADGTLWIAAGTYSFDTPAVGSSYQRTFAGGGDAYIAHVKPSLGADGLLYSTFLGGTGLEEARSVVLDAAGRVIVSGYTMSSNFPVTSNALQPKYGGNTDVFVSVLDPAMPPDQQLIYSTYFGGANADAAFDLKRDANGALYLAGYTLSPGLPSVADPLQANYDGTMDAFVLKFNPSRAGASGLDYFSYLGSGGLQVAYAVDFDSGGNIFIAGSTSARILDAIGGPGKPSDPGNTDGFVLGFNACTLDTSLHSQHFSQQGGTATVDISARQTDCSWNVFSTLDWVSASPAGGSGNATVTLTVAPNDTGSPRQGNIRIGGVVFAIDQD